MGEIKGEIKIETITPERAKEILENNKRNFRIMDPKRVGAYRKDIEQGLWEVTGDSIKITNGELIDGQTRLQAVVESGIAIKTVVAYDIAESARFVDRGKPRTISQWLRYLGVKHAHAVGAVARLSSQHVAGLWDRQSVSVAEVSDQDIIDYAVNNQATIISAVRLASRAKGLMNVTVLGAVYHLGCRDLPEDDEMAIWFSSVLSGHGEMEEGDPPLTLRNRMVKEQALNQKTPHYIQRWLTTIAWNKSVKGEKVSGPGLRIRLSGPARQKPPGEVLVAGENP